MKAVSEQVMYLIIGLMIISALTAVYFKAINRTKKNIKEFTSEDLFSACKYLGVDIENNDYKPIQYLNAKKGAEIANMLINVCISKDKKEYNILRDIANNCNDKKFDTNIVKGECFPCDFGTCMPVNRISNKEYNIDILYPTFCFLNGIILKKYNGNIEIYMGNEKKANINNLEISQYYKNAECDYETKKLILEGINNPKISLNIYGTNWQIKNRTILCGYGFSVTNSYSGTLTKLETKCVSKIKYEKTTILGIVLDWCRAAMIQYQECLKYGDKNCKEDLLLTRNWCNYIDTSNLGAKNERS